MFVLYRILPPTNSLDDAFTVDTSRIRCPSARSDIDFGNYDFVNHDFFQR